MEGSLETYKKDTLSISIPYKYVVYKQKKERYEYEFIYKLDSEQETTNRCLFVKPHLLSNDGNLLCNWFSCNYLHANDIW